MATSPGPDLILFVKTRPKTELDSPHNHLAAKRPEVLPVSDMIGSLIVSLEWWRTTEAISAAGDG